MTNIPLQAKLALRCNANSQACFHRAEDVRNSHWPWRTLRTRQGSGGELYQLFSDGKDRALTFSRTYLDNFLNKAGPTSDPEWVPGQDTIDSLETSKVLSVSIGHLYKK